MSSKPFYTILFVWSRSVWVITFAWFGVWIVLSGLLLYKVFTEPSFEVPLMSFCLLNIIMLISTIICEGYAPQRLEVGEDKIVILRRYKSVELLRDEIKSVERLPDNALRWAIRTGGVGGLFGFYGNYYAQQIGAFELYTTGFRDLYLIRKWDGKQIVISCSEPDKLEHYLE